MREDAVADEVVGAFDLDVPDLFGAGGLDRDNGVPEDGGTLRGMSSCRQEGSQRRSKKYDILFHHERFTCKIEISEIQIVPQKFQNGLVAFCSFVINNQLYVGSVAVYSSPSSPTNYRLVYPQKVLTNGAKINIVHPINQEAGLFIQNKIVGEYLKLVDQITKGVIENE